jgi:integrase
VTLKSDIFSLRSSYARPKNHKSFVLYQKETKSGLVWYALEREEIDRDPFRSIGKAVETPKEKGILTPDEVIRLISAPVADPHYRLAMLLDCLCGMRMGEVRGLQWGDIKDGLIHIRHNWINGEGMKAPKCKGGAVRENSRKVPLPSSVAAILQVSCFFVFLLAPLPRIMRFLCANVVGEVRPELCLQLPRTFCSTDSTSRWTPLP